MEGWVRRIGLRGETTYFGTNKIADSFLCRANSLIPGTLRAVRVVLGDGTGGRSRVVSDLGCGVGSLVLEISLGFLGFAGILGLISYLDDNERGVESIPGQKCYLSNCRRQTGQLQTRSQRMTGQWRCSCQT
jgi:hypothetical protein